MNKFSLIIVIAISASLVYFAQAGVVSGNSFGFEKNASHRKSADAEGVAGCMQSCQDMRAGWLEMNPDSKNYTSQKEKIEAKAEQCLAMNTLAGSPVSEAEIFASCGIEPQRCVEVTTDISPISGACGDISWIKETGLPQCCVDRAPGGLDCGVDAEWVVGVAAFPSCYIPNS